MTRNQSKFEYIDKAFQTVDRVNFLPLEQRANADIDMALPVGYGQTNSQPYTVRKMLEWLDAKPGHKVLDVGSGSGWTTALLAHIVGPKGKVYAVEKVPELVEFGQGNNQRLKVKNAEFFQASDTFGLPEYAPYDRILVSASADELPYELIEQLKPGGKIVIPIRNTILEITKTNNSDYETTEHPGFIFVPLL